MSDENPFQSPNTHTVDAVIVSDESGTLRMLAWSTLVMLPWPILGVLASLQWMEELSESLLLFGGVTGILLLPLHLLDPRGVWLFPAGIGIAWFAVWLLPSLFRRTRQRRTLILVLQAVFSAGNAFLGFLMVLGKGV